MFKKVIAAVAAAATLTILTGCGGDAPATVEGEPTKATTQAPKKAEPAAKDKPATAEGAREYADAVASMDPALMEEARKHAEPGSVADVLRAPALHLINSNAYQIADSLPLVNGGSHWMTGLLH